MEFWSVVKDFSFVWFQDRRQIRLEFSYILVLSCFDWQVIPLFGDFFEERVLQCGSYCCVMIGKFFVELSTPSACDEVV